MRSFQQYYEKMSAEDNLCDICINQNVFPASNAEFVSDSNGSKRCKNHTERVGYEKLGHVRPFKHCSAFIPRDGGRRCRNTASWRIVGNDGVVVCSKHVLCLGHSTSTSLPCKISDICFLNHAFLCIHHAVPIHTEATTPVRNLATVVNVPSPAQTPTTRTTADAHPITPSEQLADMTNTVAVLSEVVNQMIVQINDLTLTVRRSENTTPVASPVETAETQSPAGPFSSRMRL